MNLSNIRGAIFDLDGLLVDSEVLAHRALIQTARMFEIEPDTVAFKGMIGLPEDASAELLQLRYGSGFAAQTFIKKAAAACEAMVLSGHLNLKPGAAQLISYLTASKVPVAVATSSTRIKAISTLAAVDMIDSFDVIVSRTDVLRGKPYPDLFARAAFQLNLPVTQCIAFEDSYNGVRAAHASGMKVVMVPDLLDPTPEMVRLADAIIPNLLTALDAFIEQVGTPGQQNH